MKPLSETDTPEEHILNLFQINKTTGFTEDFRTSLMRPLISYFGESEQEFAQMHLGGESLQAICDRFTSYRDYIEPMANKPGIRSFLSKNGVELEDIVQTLLKILHPHTASDFEYDFSEIKHEVVKELPDRGYLVNLLADFNKKYFPQGKDFVQKGALEFQIVEFREETLAAVRSIMEN
ncbi:hypothetical protein LR010_00760 [Candidatus Gracilibacteria bacterium]|nr:hypothetical protein [Candidatus Gracilibacteria bacterium]